MNLDHRLAGTVTLVTGGGSGIGYFTGAQIPVEGGYLST
jgi:NAD(P)-dependent dehydrogenase (short-subunit alcohol dehydrogenase family)